MMLANVWIGLVVMLANMAGYDLLLIRNTFHASLANDAVCKSLHKYFSTNPSKDPVAISYHAANTAMHARFLGNPYDKLKALKESGRLFDTAIAQQPNDPEIRYLRVLIELNLPSFLPIDKHVDNDLVIVIEKLSLLNAALGAEHFETARKFLLDKAPLNTGQRQTLRQWKP